MTSCILQITIIKIADLNFKTYTIIKKKLKKIDINKTKNKRNIIILLSK